MRSEEITIGCTTKHNVIGVDVSLEGPSWKISSCLDVVKLRDTEKLVIAKEGKKPIFIYGKPVSPRNEHKRENGVVEFPNLKFIFLVNQDLISVIQSEVPQSS
ncbi:hypothetical protein HPB51_004661 [Rhipicephalus microplus]|uniref:Uncharacterized protein n=1 Tax=Rhipicephalus microplus TaxID=6941 RepID=A0A9J6EXK7_RHIMP|nr:hypothetical protein HPB51_004661 [Rhipicephalus microplus]